MENITEKVSYIIGYRQSNQERYDALVFILSLLRKYFPTLEIIVVEQDAEPKLQLEDSLNIKQLFIKKSDLYNCCKNFNFGAAQSDKEFLVFACSDVFLGKEDYLQLFRAGEDFEAVTPHKTEMFNIKITDRSEHQFEILNTRELYTFAGGIVLLTRSGFEKTGGWDERFEGWGGDDDVMSHVILNKLISKTFRRPFYHIDHPRTVNDGKGQPKFKENLRLQQEIMTMSGIALDRYIDFLKDKKKSSFSKIPKYVLAVTTYNHLDYLKRIIETFFKTRNKKAHWEIIIADDNPSEENQNYLSFLEEKYGAIIIRNNRVGEHRQANIILKKLSKMDFDICFKCNDDLIFKAAGWDDLYWDSIQRNGYDHLVFYDKSRQPDFNLNKSFRHGDLAAHCEPENIQGGFYTMTKRVLEEVGYFDEQLFGRRGLGQVDYCFRCCRAGFNVLAHPYDLADSNNFLGLQSPNDKPSKYKDLIETDNAIWHKQQLTKANRKYIPYNENFYTLEVSNSENKKQILGEKFQVAPNFHKADATFYPKRGISGFVGFLLKRFYNFGINMGWNFIPKGIKSLGRFLNKLGLNLINIER